ncbi:MAG TPA: hypothetical protein VK797_06860 [Tepidisphaeraceae bacterium]|nr:hypothetical protein [Tepidisphaeraceae bacterium]
MADAAPPGAQSSSLSEDLFCPECGYDLRGSASDRCPECGLAIDRAGMSVSRIPWVHRREIGRFRAYWRTTWMVMVRRRRLADEMNRPITIADARRFWLVTVVLAWLPIAAWAVGLAVADFEPRDFRAGVRLGYLLEAAIFAAALFAVWLFLLLATGSMSNWFVSDTFQGDRQDRAIALSYFTCAPLGWLWLPAALGLLWLGADQIRARGLLEQIELIGLIGPEVLAVVLFMRTGLGAIFLMRAVTHCGPGRTFAMCVGLPLSWALLALVMAMIPLAATLISLAVLSFR